VGGQLRRPPRTGNAALGIDDDRARLDVLAGDEWCESQNARLRIATGVGDELGTANLVAIDFRQSINRLGEVGEIVVTLPIPLGVDVGIAKPIVGAEIDDAHAALQELRHGGRTGAMG
jgi:hypothetical protein